MARRLLSDGFGLLFLAAAVVLAWPGVRVAEASDAGAALMSVDPVLVKAQAGEAKAGVAAAPAPEKDAASCSDPGAPSTLNDAMVAHQIRRAMREYAQRMQAEGGPQDPSRGIVLNGTGYNYKPMRLEDR